MPSQITQGIASPLHSCEKLFIAMPPQIAQEIPLVLSTWNLLLQSSVPKPRGRNSCDAGGGEGSLTNLEISAWSAFLP